MSTQRETARTPEDLTRLVVQRVRAKDAAGVAELYEPDAVVAFPPGAMTVGREAIRKLYEQLIEQAPAFTPEEPLPTVQIGDLALTATAGQGRGRRPGAGGPPAARRELAAAAGPPRLPRLTGPGDAPGVSACGADPWPCPGTRARCPSRRATAADSSGATPAIEAPSRRLSGATSTSARLCSIARITAEATSSGVRVPTPRGSSTSASANIPASRMNPGSTTETPTPSWRRSSRSDSANPRRPNFVAEYSDEAGLALLPDSEDTNTM